MIGLGRVWLQEELKSVPVGGLAIDLGCGRRVHGAGAYELIRVDGDPACDPDVVTDLEQPLPFPDNYADCVLMVNVLEHIFGYVGLLWEVRRVLKPGGRLIASVPFLFAVHRTEYMHDYRRVTAEGWRKVLEDLGFVVEELRVLDVGPYRAAVNLIAQELHFATLFRLLLAVAGVGDWLWKRYRKWGASWMEYPIEYLMVARA